MSNLSQKDKHSPIIHTAQTTLDQTKPQQDSTSLPNQHPEQKEIHTKAVQGLKPAVSK